MLFCSSESCWYDVWSIYDAFLAFFSFILGGYIPLYVHAGLKNFFFHASYNLDCS